MIEWIVSLIPWPVWLGLGVIALGTLRVFAGSWKNVWIGAVGIAGVVGSILLFKRGQSVGETRIKRKQKEDIDALEQHYRDIEAGNRPDLERDIERLRRLGDE